ncbi:WGR domain-containing protein [Novosphingobium sp. KCTC 2891]|uniref:WGR domain-containing protein n=1 Tax=Novosphingobium sp. KCTC 2891 TaxID=2989730 RepID=UPI002222C1B2|nr:WGR domain-containing protein [Novosphingobium sp. KCTC 2891]MCW1385065.1 WGR domain-containing protein [Novosphingobium sp. KCTC 2891]
MASAEPQDFHVWLEAVSPERNIARRYAISLSRDLFGACLVEVSWGRIGRRGQARTLSFSERPDAERFVRQLQRRRMSARRRIGVPYREIRAAGRDLATCQG